MTWRALNTKKQNEDTQLADVGGGQLLAPDWKEERKNVANHFPRNII